MDNKTNPVRNEPADKEVKSDPNVRDDSGIKPGASTVSSSKSDQTDEEVLSTGKDSFEGEKGNDNADLRYDEIKDRS